MIDRKPKDLLKSLLALEFLADEDGWYGVLERKFDEGYNCVIHTHEYYRAERIMREIAEFLRSHKGRSKTNENNDNQPRAGPRRS
ncbi:MAG: hypothetical protein ABIH23_12400 [bacterium]